MVTRPRPRVRSAGANTSALITRDRKGRGTLVDILAPRHLAQPRRARAHQGRYTRREGVRFEVPILCHVHGLLAESPFELGNPAERVPGARCAVRRAAEIEPRRTGPLRPQDQIPEQWMHDSHAREIAGPGGSAGEIAHALPVPPSPREAEQGVRPFPVRAEQPDQPRGVRHAARQFDDALPIPHLLVARTRTRSEEHTSELQSLAYLVCRLLLEKKKNTTRA